MPYPDLDFKFLFYSDKKALKIHQTRPSGLPDISRLAKGKSDFWLSPSLAKELKKKTLILSAFVWSYYKASAVRDLLSNLIKDGFEIYMWQNGNLIKLKQDNLTLIFHDEFNINLKLPCNKSIDDVAAKKFRLPKDTIQILDDYFINYLLGNAHELGPRNLSVSDYREIIYMARARGYSDESLNKFFKHLQPEVKLLTLDVLKTSIDAPEQNRFWRDLCIKFPEALRETKYKIAELGEIHDFTYEPTDHLNIEEMSFISSNISSLTSFLTSFPNLKKIDLFGRQNIRSDFYLEKDVSTNLVEISFSQCNISLNVLKAILAASPKLKKIDINGERIALNGLTRDDCKLFNNIEKIYIDGSYISSDCLELILASSPKLIELWVSGSLNTTIDLNAILTSLPNLQKLQLYQCQNISTNFDIDKFKHLNLLYIDLSITGVSTAALKAILTVLPNLKKIDLSGCSPAIANLSLEDHTLFQNIEEISLGSNYISAKVLSVILKTSTNLIKINLCNCPNIMANFALEKGEYFNLEEINLNGSHILSADLKNILMASPKLKNINLSNCFHDAYELSPEVMDLLYLMRNNGVEIIPPDFISQKRSAPIMHSSRSAPIMHSSNVAFDADTHMEENKTFKCRAIFFPRALAPVSSYRLNIYQKSIVNQSPCTSDVAFSLSKEGDFNFVSCDIKESDKDLYSTLVPTKKSIYGKYHLTLTNQWQALPSLSPTELMTSYHLSTAAKVAIQYSERDNLYYIISTESEPKELDIDFILDIPLASTMPKELKSVVDDFNYFGSGALDMSETPNPTGADYLKAIRTQRKGACRHRAIAFKAMMDEKKLESRIITNQCHAFVEVKIDGAWITCDLGGYPANLEIDASNMPKKEGIAPTIIYETYAPEPLADSVSRKVYEQGLTTWEKRTLLTDRADEFFQRCVNGLLRKRLIECITEEELSDLHFALQSYCKTIKRDIYYINSPDDLICASSYIDKTGQLKKGPGGPLHDFLTNPDFKNRVLVVNYGAFAADDLVKFNSLLDDVRKADGTNISEDTIIIGLINKDSETVAPGRDFYSRIGTKGVETCPLSAEVLRQNRPLPAMLPELSEVSEERYTINLYHSTDWKERLLGSFVPKASGWVFEEGELQKAIASGLPIEIKNGLNDDKEYCRFWREAFQLGAIVSDFINIPLSEELKARFKATDGYNWKLLKERFVAVDDLSDDDFIVLNVQTISDLFNIYSISNKKLIRNDGFIEKHKNKELKLHLTSELSDDEWAKILEECDFYKVNLKVYVAAGVSIPKELQSEGFAVKPAFFMAKLEPIDDKTQVIESSDVDSTVALLVGKRRDIKVIDISECHDHDLLSRIDHKLVENDNPYFEFSETTCAVKQALEAEETVILKGIISQALADELAPLLLGRKTEAKGMLILVSKYTSSLQYMPRQKHEVSLDDKKALLGDVSTIEPYLEDESLSSLKARLRDQDAWIGMRHLDMPIFDLSALDGELAAAKTKEFKDRRKDAVAKVLVTEPFVFLTGLSGAGKTSFVLEEYASKDKKDIISFYQGEDKLSKWAEDNKDDKDKILFIDEANLSDSEWSIFEGLYNNPPGILLDGRYVDLTNKHKVIFAGNPVSYGDERKLASFFSRHGNAVLFEPLPSAMLYESILKPVFKDSLLAEHALAISKPLLEVYKFLAENSKTELLISPRELQMIALLTVSHCDFAKYDNQLDVAKYFTHQIARHLVPSELKEEFYKKFNIDSIKITPREIATKDFLITTSRKEVAQKLIEFLKLRELRPKGNNDAKRFGGLGGIILDGEPGIGKSKFVLETLVALGYKEQTQLNDPIPATNSKPFYQMPVGMAQTEKENLLLKAFNEGAVVLVDEINSSPMMERMLNSLLMGKTPDGKLPQNPGFMVIGTQNPITMAGRRAPSTALARRMCVIALPPYPKEEMVDILVKKGVVVAEAKLLVNVYQERLAFAIKSNKEPVPTFRDLLKFSETILTGTLKAQGVALIDAGILVNQSIFKKPSIIDQSLLVKLRSDNKKAFKLFKKNYQLDDKLNNKLKVLVKKLNAAIKIYGLSNGDHVAKKALKSEYVRIITEIVDDIKNTPSLKYNGHFTNILKSVEKFLNKLLKLFFKTIIPKAYTTATKVDIFKTNIEILATGLNLDKPDPEEDNQVSP